MRDEKFGSSVLRRLGRSVTLAYAIGATIVFGLAASARPQERYESGPFKGFVTEQPVLDVIRIAQPFKVPAVVGRVVYFTALGAGETPLAGVIFEVRDNSGRVLSATTDTKGTFKIDGVPQGTYEFKVTKNGFHSVIGTIIVSSEVPRKKDIRIQLQLGT
jgi:hypothetical protein